METSRSADQGIHGSVWWFEILDLFFLNRPFTYGWAALTLVAARWSIETLFSDLKEHLGMKAWQVRIEGSVIRSVPLTCVATSLLLLWSLQEADQRAPEFWDIQPWDTKKSSPSLFDVMNQFKARCITNSIFGVLKKEGIDAHKYQEIEFLLRRAA